MRARALRGRVHRQGPLCIYGDGESEGTMRHLFTAVYVRMCCLARAIVRRSLARAPGRRRGFLIRGGGGWWRRRGFIRRCQLNRRIIGAN
jgi:hypothetical protein